MLLCHTASAQQLHFRKLGSDEGLTVNTINKIVQDKQGFIWVATMDGLNRFDGYTVKQYYAGNSEQSILPHNDVINLFCDADGFLWISTTDIGITRYHPQTGDKTIFKKDTTGNGLLNIWVNDFAQSTNRGVWLATRKGLCYAGNSNKITRIDTAELDVNILDIMVVDSQTLWLSTRKGLLIFDTKTERVTKRLFDDKTIGKTERWKDGLFLAILQNERLVLLDDKGNECLLKEPLLTIPILTLLTDQSGVVWIATQTGLLRYDVATGHYKNYQHNAYDTRSLSTDVLTSLFEDKTGTLWAGSFNAGINYFDPKGIGFNVLQSPLQLQVFNNVIMGISEDQEGTIWMANGGGLTSWNRKNNQIHNIGYDATRKDALPPFTAARSVCVASDGSLWVGTGGKGVLRRKKNAKEFITYSYDPNNPSKGLSNTFVYSIQQLRNGEIWASTSRGVNRFNPAINQFDNFSTDSILKAVAQISVWKVSDDSRGNTWFATPGNGAYCWDRKQQKLLHYEVNKTHPDQGIVYNQVWCVAEDKQGNHWLGTTNGLSKIDLRTQKITNYTAANGLPNHNIYGILCDAKGDLWMSSNKGIIKFDMVHQEFKNYQTNDGVQSNEFNQEAFYASTRTGEFFFGGVKGINYFNPLLIKETKAPPSVFIGDILVFEGQNIKQILTGESFTLDLGYKQDFVSIQFASDDYYHNTQTRYRYKLVGVDNGWIDGGNNHSATYSNLVPGTYQFEVIASNNGVNWSEQPALVHIHITPPFWQKWWFRLLLAIVIPACIGLFIRKQFEEVRRKARLSEELVELKMQALRAQMNPHFIFNALNSIQHLIVKGDGELAFSYLSKFSRLLRLILDVSDRTFISLDKEIDMLRLYLDLEALRFDYHMQYSIKVDEDDIAGLSIPTLLLQPYVENAIWHGLVPKQGERTLQITIVVTEQDVNISIEDNGIGRKKAAEMKSMQPIRYESKGMNINNDRLGLLGIKEMGSIKIDDLVNKDGEATGTRVRIKLPIAALINRNI